MGTLRIPDDMFVAGTLAARQMTIPDGSVTDDAVAASAGIAATKLEHQHALVYRQADGTDVVSETMPLWTCRGSSATAVAIEAVCLTAPAGGDKQVTVDLKKCNQASPTPASILASTITIDSTKSDAEVITGTIDTADLSDGDTLVIEVTASGSTGTQAQGLVVTVTVREDAD